MCRPIFESGKAVILENGFCVVKGIIELNAKGVYSAALIKKWCYWPRGVPGDLIDNHFENTEVGDVVMIEAITEDNKFLKYFLWKSWIMR